MRLRPLVIAVAGLTILACAPQKAASAVVFPHLNISEPASGSSLEGTANVTGTASAGTYPLKKIVVGVDGANYSQASGLNQWNSVLNTGSYSDGDHRITVRAVDYAGNYSESSVPVSFANAPGSSPLPASTTPSPTPAPSTQTTAASTPTSTLAFGAQYHGIWDDYGSTERVQVLDKLAQAGAKWIRVDVAWSAMEGSGAGQITSWYIQRLDNIVNAATQRGLKVLVLYYATPKWANGNKAWNVPPTDLGQYARTAKWMAQHFAHRVSAWEVWNEPNHSASWTGSLTQYVNLLKQAYPAFKAGDPSSLVVLGGPAGNDTDWVKQMYAAGGRGSFDVMATHPYMYPSDLPPETDTGSTSTITDVRAVKSIMDNNGDGSKPIWFTEFGWSTHVNTGNEPPGQRGVSPDTQADYLVRTLKMLKANFPYVTNAFWYCERDTDTSGSFYSSYGLLNRDLTPKPAYTAVSAYLASNP